MIALAPRAKTGQSARVSDRDHEEWNRRYETYMEHASVPAPEPSNARRDLLFYVVGLSVLFGLGGLVGGPLDWQSPTWPQRCGNFGIMFAIGAFLGLRLFLSRSKD